jgi:hypothetical protein
MNNRGLSPIIVPRPIRKYLRSISLNERLRLGVNHSYAYVRNNPLKLIDPLGLMDLEMIRDTGTLYVWDDFGELMFSCRAGNNVTRDRGTIGDRPRFPRG